MKIRKFLMAFLVLGSAVASAATTLVKPDFVSAQTIERHGQVLVSAKVSTSGRAKLTKADSEITFDIGGNQRTLKRRVPIIGDKIEFGPFSQDEARRIVQEINRRL